MSKAVQVLCDAEDSNKDIIAQRSLLLQEAVENNTLVSVACYDTAKEKDVIVLVVMTKDGGEGVAQYAPIGTLFYPDDDSFMSMQPPASALVVEDAVDV